MYKINCQFLCVYFAGFFLGLYGVIQVVAPLNSDVYLFIFRYLFAFQFWAATNLEEIDFKMVVGLINANPTVYEKKERRTRPVSSDVVDEYAVEPIDELEIFDILLPLPISNEIHFMLSSCEKSLMATCKPFCKT